MVRLRRISSGDIFVTRHPADGFTLSYIGDDTRYFKCRYIGYTLKEALGRFREYVREEDARVFRNVEAV